MKKLLYTLFTTVLSTATAFSQGEQLYANGTATDQDGNTFEWINYGTQDWAIENAEVVTYSDGTEIPQVTDDTEWRYIPTGAWCYYDNDPSKGKLYNWYAVMGIHDNDPNTPNKEFAPEGWHVPNDAEWTELENHLIANGYNYDGTTTENKIAKAMASTASINSEIYGWFNYGGDDGDIGVDHSLNNSSGFNAQPVGYRFCGGFHYEGRRAVFWSPTEDSTGDENYWRYLNFVWNDLIRTPSDLCNGLSVRFVRGASSAGIYLDIKLSGTISAENNQIKNVADPTEAQDVTTKSYVDNSVSNTYTQAEVDAIISSLQSQIDALQPTSVTDQDGNTYEYLTYGDQVWTVENAEMVTYRDGTEIPEVTDGTAWSNLTTGAWCYYDNDSTKGRLYNWYAIMGIHDAASLADATLRKAFAPEGWHVPSDAEWTTLENYLITNGYNYDGTTTGNKIAKAMASTTGWISWTEPGTVGNEQSLNNSSGFNAFPEGFRWFDGMFEGEGYNAVLWSSTEFGTNSGWFRSLRRSRIYLDVSSDFYYKQNGNSVRFVKDN